MRIALISCTKLKQNYPCQAQEMYLQSTLFKKASNYIKQQHYDKWFILSAKYGLLEPNTIIEPYNTTLNNMNALDIKTWSQNVYKKLIQYNPNEIDFYTGEKYRKYLIPLLKENNIIVNIPLMGHGIGEQLHFYTQYKGE
jgi:hypothetical protein